jgi:hypothetical protein
MATLGAAAKEANLPGIEGANKSLCHLVERLVFGFKWTTIWAHRRSERRYQEFRSCVVFAHSQA